MSTMIDQKAYLQKYFSGEKKKKKKKVAKGKGLKIIDDDIDLSKLRPLDGDELDILGEGEDAPQIAGIIDERPEEVKKLEQFKTSSKWRVINQDDGFSSKLSIEEIKKDIKEVEKENELIFGKMYSDSEDEKSDSDPSPPRKLTANSVKSKKHSSNSETSQKVSKPIQNSDSDFSSPKTGSNKDTKNKTHSNYDSDLSPPRKSNQSSTSKERARKPSRWGEIDKRSSHSPKRLQKRVSSPRKSRNDSDASPPRKSSKRYSDVSPARKKEICKKSNDSDLSPIRGSNKEEHRRSDSYPSSPRKRQSPGRSKNRSEDKHNRNKHPGPSCLKNSSDSDLSPPRKKSSKNQRSSSPRRKSRKRSPVRNKQKQNSDSDLSPPRKDKGRIDDRPRRNSDSPPPTNKKMASRTLEGKKAGLQDAIQLRQENEAFRRREEEAFSKLADEVSGRNATAVSRRSKRETSEERRKQKEKAERQKDLDEKYKKWSKGIKQLEAQESRVQDFLHESSKPLARHRDDRDLESSLKQVERAGDPMLQYIRERKRERGEMPPEKPTFRGNFPPNRFNIRPGYRWDGVDRSNGYEKKYFETQSKKKAMEEEAYKWSTEDL